MILDSSAALADPRRRIAISRRILARNGCESMVAGHVSERSSDDAGFWVSPFGYFDETTPEMVIKVDFDLNRLEGDWDPSPAIQFHAAIYRKRPDVGSVIHIHSHYVSVFSTVGQPIGMYNVGSVLFYDDQVLHADDGSGPPVVGTTLAEELGDKRVVLIKNHGAIVASQSLERATIEAMMLEVAARYHIEAQAIGGTEFPEAEVIRGRAAYHRHFLPNMWDANVRRLQRSDPELFEATILPAGDDLVAHGR
ncbi:MAG TPA: class II aldolase/adducin family protein [Ilumatobacteraceae bacterium]|nr:class II aldolase/adducin family protein [Ilumatobacteraceae bacterium]